jgi:hypothetical protein
MPAGFPMLRRLIWLSAIGLLVAGCQSAETFPSAKKSALGAKSAQAHSAAKPGADAATADQADRPTAAKPAVAAKFDPPFPNRTELFEPPRGGQGMIRRDEEHGETIELKGFVDVDGPQVVLSIDGVLSPIPEGGERYGVQVISIHPPSVVLQRGRSRWTASLE